MNESINSKPAIAFLLKDATISGVSRVRRALLVVVLVLVNPPQTASAQSSSCLGIHVNFLGIKNSVGFDAPSFAAAGFPSGEQDMELTIRLHY